MKTYAALVYAANKHATPIFGHDNYPHRTCPASRRYDLCAGYTAPIKKDESPRIRL